MASNKKTRKKKTKLTDRIYDVKMSTWKAIAWLAAACMLLPVLFDVLIPETRYDSSVVDPQDLIVIRDDADLLTDGEEKQLYEHMLPITQYGGAAFYTTEGYVSSTESYARKCYRENFGTKSGTIFVIDMYNRYLYIFSDGRIYNTVTKAKAETITDNVYLSARAGNYYRCAEKTFDQIAAILDGNQIPQPMKHISNALLSLAFSLVIVFAIANAKNRMQKESELRVYDEMARKKFTVGAPVKKELVKTKRRIHVESSGGSSGGFSSGGGGGGGGSSGGGGGHGF